MRLGLSSWTLPWAVAAQAIDAAGLIEIAAAWGLRAVQLADNVVLPEPAALSARARGHGIALSLGVRGSDETTLRSAMLTAGALGARLLRLLLDRGDDRPGHDEAVRRLRAVAAAARDTGLVLAVENHDRLRAAELAAIVRAAGCGVCLDTVNNLGAAEGPREVVAALAPLVVDLHLKDFRIERQPSGLGFIVAGAPAGDGMLDVPWLLGELRRHGRDPDAIIELWTPPPTDGSPPIATERAWAERSIANLRPIIPA